MSIRIGRFVAPRRHRIPASVAPLVSLTTAPQNYGYMLAFDRWSTAPVYLRELDLLEGTGSTVNVAFRAFKRASPNENHRPLGPVPYGWTTEAQAALRHDAITQVFTLRLNGVASASKTITQPAKTDDANPAYIQLSSFTLDLTGIAEGWYTMTIDGSPQETSIPYFIYVRKGAIAAEQSHVPIITDSYDLDHYDSPICYGMVPADLRPTPRPLAGVRECPPFSTALPASQLFRENISPPIMNMMQRRISVTANGVKQTFHVQSYYDFMMMEKYPAVHLLDGPRGVHALPMVTHMMFDRHGGLYCADPWRVFRVDPKGNVTTRAGYRHDHATLPYWEQSRASNLNHVLVGDWSAVPVERRGFHEIWGLAFDLNSVSEAALNTSAPEQINPVDGALEHPHSNSPRLFVADTQNNRIVLLTFNPNSFTDEPVVTEFITGLGNPWDCVWHDNVLYVSERTNNRIAAFDAVTGAFIRIVVSGAAGHGYLDAYRSPKLIGTLESARAEQTVMPEGLYIHDGWLYYGSTVTAEIKRVHLTTDVIEHACYPYVDAKSNFMKISVSDGTFGPAGTMFMSTWSISNHGYPHAYLPDGTQWKYSSTGYDVPIRGKGGVWDNMGYGSASCVGHGRLCCTGSGEGIVQISKALATDPTINMAQYKAGRLKWVDSSRFLLHGHWGFGSFGLPLPWGEDADIDYFLTVNGLT